MKRIPYTDPFWRRPVLAEDFSKLILRKDTTRTRQTGPNRPRKVLQ